MVDRPRVEHYSAERIPNAYPGGKLPWQLYHTVRNAVLRCCRAFGSVGPMGECPIVDGHEIPDGDWHVEQRGPVDFFVVDDQYNDERYIYVEIGTRAVFTEAWLRDLMLTLADFPGWGVGILGLKSAYVLAFADKLMVTGRILEECTNVQCIISKVRDEIPRRLG